MLSKKNTFTNTYQTLKVKNLKNRLFLFKILALFFAAIPIFQKYSSRYITDDLLDYNIALFVTLFAFLIICGILFLWWLFSELQQKYPKVIWVEILCFFLIFTAIFYITGGISSPYKYLYLILIVTYTIELGELVGVGLAIVTSCFLLVTDLTAPDVRIYFETDLSVATLFIVIAWALGYYVKLEQTHIDYLTTIANMDGLTEIYNHRYFHEVMHVLFNKRRKERADLSLILIDVDFFKEYNDLFGHQKGDELLITIVHIMKEVTPEDALLFRYGGDEFCIVLDEISEEDAVKIGESVRVAIRSFNHSGMEHLPNKKLTVSVGIASLKDDMDSHYALIENADSALYRAKYLRRNRVEAYGNVWKMFKEHNDPNIEETLKYVKTLIGIIDAKDKYTYFHLERVAHYCELFADHLKLPPKEKSLLIFGAYLHDLGKINISKEILIADHKLSNKEWNELKRHPEESAIIIEKMGGFEDIIPIIRHHHERYDGSGYPDQLSSNQIPLLARLLSVVDSFDAMTNKRPYQKTRTIEQGLEELLRCSGTQFDPYYVNEFVDMMRKSS